MYSNTVPGKTILFRLALDVDAVKAVGLHSLAHRQYLLPWQLHGRTVEGFFVVLGLPLAFGKLWVGVLVCKMDSRTAWLLLR